jgi:hypothetical protein
MLNYCGYNTFLGGGLYDNDLEFTASYQAVDICKQVSRFHLEDGLLLHLGHLYVLLDECEKIIWEACYNLMVRHFDMHKIMEIQ